MSASQNKTELTKPRLSLFQGILPLDRSRVLADIMAGITLAAVGIPEVMGHTEIQSTKGHPCQNPKTSRRSWF